MKQFYASKSTIKNTLTATLFAVLAGTSAQAQLSYFNPSTQLYQQGVFIKTNLSLTGGHSEGPVACGGNLSYSASYGINGNSQATYTGGGSTALGMIVGGQIDFTNAGTNILQLQNGWAKIASIPSPQNHYPNGMPSGDGRTRLTSGNGSSTPAVSWMNGNQPSINSITGSSGVDFTTAFNTLITYSNTFAGYNDQNPTTGAYATKVNYLSYVASNNTYTLSGTKINYLHMTAAQFTAFNTYSNAFSPAPDATHILVIDVDLPASYIWNIGNMGLYGSSSPYVLWNFANTSTITMNGAEEYGTILAPKATLIKNVSQNGHFIANAATINSGETHSQFPLYTSVQFPMMSGSVLPVKEVKLTAEATATNVSLSWEAIGQEEMESYVAERSTDGKIFEAMATTAATAREHDNYSAQLTGRTGSEIEYYRIKAVSIDGRIQYSNVLPLKNKALSTVSFAPNPFNNATEMNIVTNTNQTLDYKVMNFMGQMVASGSISTEGAGSTKLSIGNSINTAGTYIITIQSGTDVLYSGKIVKL